MTRTDNDLETHVQGRKWGNFPWNKARPVQGTRCRVRRRSYLSGQSRQRQPGELRQPVQLRQVELSGCAAGLWVRHLQRNTRRRAWVLFARVGQGSGRMSLQ